MKKSVHSLEKFVKKLSFMSFDAPVMNNPVKLQEGKHSGFFLFSFFLACFVACK